MSSYEELPPPDTGTNWGLILGLIFGFLLLVGIGIAIWFFFFNVTTTTGTGTGTGVATSTHTSTGTGTGTTVATSTGTGTGIATGTGTGTGTGTALSTSTGTGFLYPQHFAGNNPQPLRSGFNADIVVQSNLSFSGTFNNMDVTWTQTGTFSLVSGQYIYTNGASGPDSDPLQLIYNFTTITVKDPNNGDSSYIYHIGLV